MTIEQLLLSALSAVTSALVYVARLLWIKSEQCEADRVALRREIEALKGEHGEAVGTLKAFEKCPQHACPFKVAAAVAVLFLFLSGCSALDGYERSYSLAYEQASVSVKLKPARAYAK